MFLDQQAGQCDRSHSDRKERGRKSGWRRTQMIQALGFLVSLLGSFRSAWKLLEGFNTSLPAFASPFWVRRRPRAGLAGVAEEVRSNYRQS